MMMIRCASPRSQIPCPVSIHRGAGRIDVVSRVLPGPIAFCFLSPEYQQGGNPHPFHPALTTSSLPTTHRHCPLLVPSLM